MRDTVLLFLASILAGFALMNMEAVSFLSGLESLFDMVGALAILVFSAGTLWMGVKSLFGK